MFVVSRVAGGGETQRRRVGSVLPEGLVIMCHRQTLSGQESKLESFCERGLGGRSSIVCGRH